MMAAKQNEPKRASQVSFKGPATVMRPPPGSAAPQAGNLLSVNGQQQTPGQQRRVSQLFSKDADITVCDITGDWGLYQSSVCMFAICYSALAAITVVLGPILTPDMQFKCAETNSNYNQQLGALQPTNSSQHQQPQHECFKIIQPASEPQDGLMPPTPIAQPCQTFLYDDHQLGLTLTNGFNLVCERQWLRSLVSSAALAGMLISSVTLGVFSDRYGRLRCVQLGFLISLSANAYAIITRDYFLFCACIMLMSYAQVGAANALCTLMMEITSPRFRFVPVFEYGIGWGLGVILIPFLYLQTLDYRWFMGAVFVGQIALIPWLHFGVIESIRWLLSEGHFNRAQIELRRVCRFNRVRQDGAKLAQEIASIQAQQVRKASRVIEREAAPRQLARALGTQVDETARELDMLSAAIQKSFFGADLDDEEPGKDLAPRPSIVVTNGLTATTNIDAPSSGPPMIQVTPVLSPTLSRLSFSVSQLENEPSVIQTPQRRRQSELQRASSAERRSQLEAVLADGQYRRDSFTTQGLIQLALKYSRAVEKQKAGSFFLVQMFHPCLWRCSLILMLISIMYETSYYGLIQANKFVGKSVALNYVIGGFGDWAGAFVSTVMLVVCSRKFSLVSTTLIGAAICFAMAASYHLIPDHPIRSSTTQPALNSSQALRLDANGNVSLNNTLLHQRKEILRDAERLIDNESNLEPISSVDLLLEEMTLGNGSQEDEEAEKKHKELLDWRDNVNFYLIGVGKFVICVGIQVAATIAMEVYPNNLRQSGPGAILFMGRIGSIAAPFLFNDPSEDKHIFKLTLVVMSVIGLLVCFLVPFCITDNKGKELVDQLNDMDDESIDKIEERRKSRSLSYLVQTNI